MPKMKIIEVLDGDTIQGPRKTFVRLENVDAPETGTNGAAAAKHKLEDLVLDKTVSYTEEGKSYGRIVGKVKIAGKSVNTTMKNFLRRQK